MGKKKIMHSTQHGFAINVLAIMTTENPLKIRKPFVERSLSIFLGGGVSIMTCITSFQENKMSKIFSLTVIEKRNNKKELIFRNRLKKLNFDKTFEDIIENELDFHDCKS